MANVLLFFRSKPLFPFCRKCIYILLTFFAFSASAYAQTTLQGVVVDKTNSPIPGVAVIIKSTDVGTVTDVNGKFGFTANQPLPLPLTVSFLGYKTQEVDVYEANEPIHIVLEEDINRLNEVVVVGYGTQRRKELTGAISSISKATLSVPTTSFDNLLGGSVSGLNITQGGQPGATFSARIRGGNSINAGNEPLFVVDGVILYGNTTTEAGVSQVTASLNPLSAINPNDIESIEILKDVSATAIYGSRGSNGVIIITTKNGPKKGKGNDNIQYQYSIGWQEATKKLDLLTAGEWASLNKEVDPNGTFKDYTDAQIAALGKGYDWQNAALRTAANYNHNISFSGGNEKTRYFLSGNYTNQDGILRNTGFKRYTGRFNFDRDVLSNLSVNLTLNASKLEQNGLNNYPSYANGLSNPFESIIRTSPANPIYNADGSFNYNNQYELGDLIKGDVTTNALSDLLNTTAQNLSNSLLGNFSLRYAIIPGLVLKLSAGTNLANSTQNYYAPSYTAGGFQPNGYASVGNRRTDIWQYEYTLNYTKQLNKDHYIDALAGYTTQTTLTEYTTASATDFANEQLLWHSLQSGATRQAPYSGGSEAILNSVIGRINYSLKGRYNLTATFRADGSSRFASNNKWGYFPSIGLSWNVDEEAFLKNNGIISDFKLRASIGTVGNQEIGDYLYAATYGTTNNYSFNDQLVVGYTRTNLENPDLKWEQTTSYNVGADIGVLNHRLNFTVDAYYKNTSDLLLSTPVEISTGFSSVLRNVGSVSNKGIEFEARGLIVNTKDLNWTVSGNIAKNINKVEDLGPGITNIGTTIFKGEPLGVHYLIEYDGIVQKGDDLTQIAGPSWKPTVEPGDEKFVNHKDVGGTTVVDETNDRVILGTSNPDVTYGFSSTLSYKSFSLLVAFQGVAGNKLYNSLRQSLEQPNKAYNGLAALNDRWTDSNPSTTIPKARYYTTTYRTSRYLEDGAFLRLKNITLNYTLPVTIPAAPSAKFRVFASGQNLLTLTKFTGYDPETGGGTAYPLSRTISLGVNLSY
ncbi:MAG: TonB-dependent receptor [Breznakibacter sp.]